MERFKPPQINMSRIEIAGSGGLGMLMMAALTAIALPEARIFVAFSLVLGGVAAAAMIGYRRQHGPFVDDDDADHPLHLDATRERLARRGAASSNGAHLTAVLPA